MTITESYIDFGGTVYTFDKIQQLPQTKENAFLHYIGMTVKSWTFHRMTEQEKTRCINALYWTVEQDALKGTFYNRWMILQSVYNAFLAGIGYSGGDWRKNGVDAPQVVVEVESGLVTNVYSNSPVSVSVLDFDNLNAGDEYAEEVYKDFHAAKGMERVY